MSSPFFLYFFQVKISHIVVNWIPKFNLFFLILTGLQILNGFNIIGNRIIHAPIGVVELTILLLVLSFIPFHIVALSKEATKVLEKKERFAKYKRIVSKIKRASFFYTLMGFLFILSVILSGVGVSTNISHKFLHTLSVMIFPVVIIYVFAKHYYLGLLLYKIEEKIAS